jgi:hypothetical protein
MANRKKIPDAIRSAVLMSNRHACCVCQKPRVQLHHIDGDPSNGVAENLAALCTDHHDQASMVIGLTAKLRPQEVLQYKRSWEEHCRSDILALSRDRVRYYVTLYKNPPRIREAFLRLGDVEREAAVQRVIRWLEDEQTLKMEDQGFDWQTVPKQDKLTFYLLAGAHHGETWPECLHRVPGHPEDQDLPTDLSPPYGMTAFHGFDSYCQILVRVLSAVTDPIPLDDIYKLKTTAAINALSGSLISFEESVVGTSVRSPRAWKEQPTGRLDIERKIGRTLFHVRMHLKTMYVFSDTSAENLERCRTRGIGILGGVDQPRPGAFELQVVPLLIGMGGFGQSDPSGWGWKPEFSPRP